MIKIMHRKVNMFVALPFRQGDGTGKKKRTMSAAKSIHIMIHVWRSLFLLALSSENRHIWKAEEEGKVVGSVDTRCNFSLG